MYSQELSENTGKVGKTSQGVVSKTACGLLSLLLLLLCPPMIHAARVTLAWDSNNPTPNGYRLFQRTPGDVYDYTSPVWSGSATTAVIDNLAEGTDYYFVVRAYVGAEESGDSNEVTYRSEPAVMYTITASAGPNGNLSPAGSLDVPASTDKTFSIAADAHYHVEKVVVDGIAVGTMSTYTFPSVKADHSISATFAPDVYTIYATAGADGRISPTGGAIVPYGEDRTYTITPDSGYAIDDVVVDGRSAGAVSTYTFSAVGANHNITARFKQTPVTYLLLSTAGDGGTISPTGGLNALQGSNQTYIINPEKDYRIADVTVDGVSVGAVTSYTFNDLNAGHSITAAFEKTNHTIRASAGEGGTIAPTGQVIVASGADQPFAVTAQEGYQVDDVLVDGISQGPLNTYVFSHVAGDHTIEAVVSPVNQGPVVDAGPDQTVDEKMIVTLSGANSMDPDDGIAAFKWRQVAGPTVDLADPTADQTTFMAPAVAKDGAALEFELTVTDYCGATARDVCIVNVTMVNMPPTADAGIDQVVDTGTQVTLDGTLSHDPENDALRYQWRQVGDGPTVTLTGAETAQPMFPAPDVTGNGASVTLELTVTDAGGLQDTDTCMVTVRAGNVEPRAIAGDDQTATAGEEVTLDGSLSADVDGIVVKYRWIQTQGTPVQLSDASAAVVTFVAPDAANTDAALVFELTVTDNQGLQGMDTCRIQVVSASPETDTTPPAIRILNPRRSTVQVRTSTISIGGTAWDDHDVVQVRWMDDHGRSGVALGTTSWRIDDLDLTSRSNTITITAYDAAGNQDSASINIYVRYVRWSWYYR